MLQSKYKVVQCEHLSMLFVEKLMGYFSKNKSGQKERKITEIIEKL